jgi:hypothetical protein
LLYTTPSTARESPLSTKRRLRPEKPPDPADQPHAKTDQHKRADQQHFDLEQRFLQSSSPRLLGFVAADLRIMRFQFSAALVLYHDRDML